MINKIYMIRNKLTQRLKIKRFEHGVNKVMFDTVAIEQEIILKIASHGIFRFLCTPADLKALVMGFLFTQGLIENTRTIKKIKFMRNFIEVELEKNQSARRSLLSKNETMECLAPALIFRLMSTLQKKQKIFPLTGGSHAALIFDIHGKILAFTEDVARHNAIDKAIGKCLINKKLLCAFGIALSSRVTFELIKKIARANIKLIACVSAPSSLAIQAAKDCGITLCGFVRGERMNVYRK